MINIVSDRDFLFIALACIVLFPLISFIFMKIKYPDEEKSVFLKREITVILSTIFVVLVVAGARLLMRV